MRYLVALLLFFGPSVLAAMLLVRAWWARSRARLSTLDGPARLLAAAAGSLPGEWAAAMESELASQTGRRARWSFAVSAARAAIFSRLTAARARDIAPSPALAAVVVAAVAGCIAATAYMLVNDAALRPVPAVLLAAVLAGFLWLGLTPPRALLTSRRAQGLGIGLGFALGSGFLWSTGFPSGTGNGVMDFVVFGSMMMLFVGAGLAAFVDGSFRSGVQTAVWGATIGMLLIFGIWLVEAVRRRTPTKGAIWPTSFG